MSPQRNRNEKGKSGRDEFDEGAPMKFPKGIFFWMLFLLFTAGIVIMAKKSGTQRTIESQLSQYYRDFHEGRIRSVRIKSDEVQWQVTTGEVYSAKDHPEHLDTLISEIASHNAKVPASQEIKMVVDQSGELLWSFALQALPWLLFLFIAWFLLFRQLRVPGGTGNVLAFGKSRAKLASKEHTGVTFDDVAGIDEAKEEVKELVEFLKNPSKFRKLGGRIPRGILLVGPPGTGKTLLAKAIAGEADVPFFSICGSDFVEMFVGVGASRVRDLFRQAKENSPCIVFLDEIDAVGRRRGSGLGGGHDEREQTLNAILVEMDGFERDEGIITIAATNRPDVLDPALLRPGRFDREIVLDLPDLRGREEILAVHAKKIRLAPDVDLRVIARGTPGFSGADLEAVINEAALIATMKNKDAVELEDLEEARDKIIWGRQKRSKVMDEEDKRIAAYHEAGHTLVGKLLPEAEPVHKVSIIPQGRALGATMFLPEKDRYHIQKKKLLTDICVALGGRVAEEIFCDDITSGAQNDFERATEIARLMVCKWGMSERLGPINYADNEEHLFLGREITRTRLHSEATAIAVDREIRRIIDECYERTKKLIQEHAEEAKRIAEALLYYETLQAEEIDKVMAGERIEREAKKPAPRAEEKTAREEKPSLEPRPLEGPELAQA